MLFPHLYGPLPTTAVVAVVPYRPPTPLGAARRRTTRSAGRWRSTCRCRSAGPSASATCPGGVAVLDPDSPLLPRQQPAAAHRRRWTPTSGRARRPRRSAATPAGRTGRRRCCWPGAGDVAAELGRRGWKTEELLLMARPAAPPAGGRARRGGRPARRCTSSGTGPGGGDLARPAAAGRGGRPAGRPGAPQRPGGGGDRPRGPRGGPGGGRRPAPGRRRHGGRGLGADRPGAPAAAGTPTRVLARALDLAARGRAATWSSSRRRPATGRGTGTPAGASRSSGRCGTSPTAAA